MEKSYYVYLVVVGVLLASIFLAPVFVYVAPGFASTLYAAWSYNCHQLASRSPFLFGQQLPVCWRDISIFASFFAGVVISTIWRARVKLRYALLGSLPLAIDGTTQLIGLRESVNVLRFTSGALFGLVWALWLVPRTPEWVEKVSEFLRREFS